MAQDQQFRAHAPKQSRASGHQKGASTIQLPASSPEADSASRRLPAFWEPYRVVTESLNNAVYIANLEGRIILGNTALVRLTAYTLKELLGCPFTEIYVPKALSVLRTNHRRVLDSVPTPIRLETEIVRKDGYHIPVELTLTTIIDGARRVGCMSVVRDLSERYQSEAQLRALLESAPD